MAFLATWTEVLGAVLLLIGFAVSWITLPLMVTMLVATITVHWENGWLAIAEGSGFFANERTMGAVDKLDRAKDILHQHGNYNWLTENGNYVILNNGIEFSATHSIFAKEFSSSPEATELIELYTSEGCSSCPPADKWMRQLKSNPQLFKKFIPLSFHVDYWNQLGWEDRFSKKQYSDRQYRHQREGNIGQVYTPGIIVNNEEWRSWRLGTLFHWPDSSRKVGVIKADYSLDSLELNVFFTPEMPIDDNVLMINTAILGMGLTSDVKLGENRGRQLKHDFVVLSQSQHQVKITKDNTQSWQVPMLLIPTEGQNKSVLVVWLSTANSQDVIQATGGYL